MARLQYLSDPRRGNCNPQETISGFISPLNGVICEIWGTQKVHPCIDNTMPAYDGCKITGPWWKTPQIVTFSTFNSNLTLFWHFPPWKDIIWWWLLIKHCRTVVERFCECTERRPGWIAFNATRTPTDIFHLADQIFLSKKHKAEIGYSPRWLLNIHLMSALAYILLTDNKRSK